MIFLSLSNHTEYKRKLTRILVTTQKNIGLLLCGNKHQSEEIPCMGSSYTHQSITSTIVFLFYRHNIKNNNFCHWLYHLQNKTWLDKIYTLNGLDDKISTTTISYLNNLDTNTQVQIMETEVSYVIIPFEENINLGDPQGIKLYLWAKNNKWKEAAKLDISVSNAKYLYNISSVEITNMDGDTLYSWYRLVQVTRRKMSHRFGNKGQAMAWLGLICSLSFRNSGKIETVVSDKMLLL